MNVRKEMDGNTAILYLEGWMDTLNAPLLADALNELEDSVEYLIFDMEKLEYISSTGIRQIIAAYKQMKGEFMIRKPSSEIMNVLSMVRLDKKLKIES